MAQTRVERALRQTVLQPMMHCRCGPSTTKPFLFSFPLNVCKELWSQKMFHLVFKLSTIILNGCLHVLGFVAGKIEWNKLAPADFDLILLIKKWTPPPRLWLGRSRTSSLTNSQSCKPSCIASVDSTAEPALAYPTLSMCVYGKFEDWTHQKQGCLVTYDVTFWTTVEILKLVGLLISQSRNLEWQIR
jgi:hypothetical protein